MDRAVTISWRDWTPRAFERAAVENKPVLLSLVTAWSAECAAMDRTTYADAAVTSLVESRFVPVRVDADRRPDISERYNLGGWPTTAFLTPAGELLSGGTYYAVEQLIAALTQVSSAWRDRAEEISARASALRHRRPDAAVRNVRLQPDRDTVQPDRDTLRVFRSLLVERFDPVNGGFGTAPRFPHAHALLFAVARAGASDDAELSAIAELTLERLEALWDDEAGGFFRCADAADWTRPSSEKTLEDNAALLHVYVEAAIRRGGETFRHRAAEIVRWARTTMSHPASGFHNAQTGRELDTARYVDHNAQMISGLLRAAGLFDDVWLRDFAIRQLEDVLLPAYQPGGGVSHEPGADVRGLLSDQVQLASALVWAHAATGQVPYSMLAAELAQFAIRTMWDGKSGTFRDRVPVDAGDVGLLREPLSPFDVNCHAACVLDRLAAITGDEAYRRRALTIVRSLAPECRRQDLFAAPHALAVHELIDRQRPAGLELDRIDWRL